MAHTAGGDQKLRKVLLARLAVLDIKMRASRDELRREELRLEVARAERDLDAASAAVPAKQPRRSDRERNNI